MLTISKIDTFSFYLLLQVHLIPFKQTEVHPLLNVWIFVQSQSHCAVSFKIRSKQLAENLQSAIPLHWRYLTAEEVEFVNLS